MSQADYIAALEAKLAQVTGIQVDAIRKNKLEDLKNEGQAIAESTAFINSIQVSKQADAIAEDANPLITKVFDLIKAECGEEAGKHALPDLPYAYDALQPHIIQEIMEIHHKKHHNGYINNLNVASGKLNDANSAGDCKAANSLAAGIIFNGGGLLNHRIFWTNMKANPSDEAPAPSGSLAAQIEKDFGSYDNFKSQFSSQTAAVKGSGWGWLAYDKSSGKLGVYTTQNQDPVELVHGAVPCLGLDVWEHAYYLQYKNLRPAYISSFFKIINWDNVQERFNNAQK